MQESTTRVLVLSEGCVRGGPASLLLLKLVTGRRHQLRYPQLPSALIIPIHFFFVLFSFFLFFFFCSFLLFPPLLYFYFYIYFSSLFFFPSEFIFGTSDTTSLVTTRMAYLMINLFRGMKYVMSRHVISNPLIHTHAYSLTHSLTHSQQDVSTCMAT